MTIWALADLHLSFGVPNKAMDVFGGKWVSHAQKIQDNWIKFISSKDLVLIAGDISWAMHLEEAVPDLLWIDKLPGTKVLIKGNHDYWWSSLSKIERVLPASCHLIQNNAFHWKDISIAGARLWDTPEFHFDHLIVKNIEKEESQQEDLANDERIFLRELGRLEASLRCLKQGAHMRIVMTHYPPISADLKESRVSQLLKKYNVDVCVFGHLHNVASNTSIFGKRDGINYVLTACDYLDLVPVEIARE